MRSLPLQLHSSLTFLRSISTLSFFACLISIATAASIPPTVATKPLFTQKITFIELPVALHFAPLHSKVRTPSPEAYMSIEDRAVTCHPGVIPRKEAFGHYVEVGSLLFYHIPMSPRKSLDVNDHSQWVRISPEFSEYPVVMKEAKETLETMITEACAVDQSENAVGFSDEEELNRSDMFMMNVLLSAKYSVFVPPDVLEKYKETSLKYREHIGSKKVEYLEIVFNVHPQSSRSWEISANFDMNIGNYRISSTKIRPRKPVVYAASLSKETPTTSQLTTPLQPYNNPGPGRKRIGFALFYGKPEEILERALGNAKPEGKLNRIGSFKKFMSDLNKEDDVKLGGVLLHNWGSAINNYEAHQAQEKERKNRRT
ncbi:hypothetical protein C8R42DRAFT_687516 [Lentinula raphanica]|nr:hypothetical protein C8R42DRAFT_687516 [Lentinula raphanica]